MEISWHSEAKEDLNRFREEVQQKIADRVSQLEENPLNEDTSLLSKQGLEIFRLKVKTGELDHRVFFDLDDGVVILGVEHRDDAYTQESIQKMKSRT